MKQIFILLLVFFPISLMSQTEGTIVKRHADGSIKSIRYSDNDQNVPASATEFLSGTIRKKETDEFVKDRTKNSINGMSFERQQQYLNGVKVEGGHFNFRFKNGRMQVVTGRYVDVSGINPNPSITEDEAINLYLSYLGKDKAEISKAEVRLSIKKIPKLRNARESDSAVLTYKVILESRSGEYIEVGYLDAHSGKLLYKTDERMFSSATGQFYTYYNRNVNDMPRTGITEYNGTNYVLWDKTRGSGIRTRLEVPFFDTQDFMDYNNIWTREELGICNVALDVHWALERIYDILAYEFDYYSYDGNNGPIEAQIDGNNNAYYELGVLHFGVSAGYSDVDPYASVDIVGHEFGHAILDKTVGWDYSGGVKEILHEGFADIWGMIFESHIRPSGDIWKAGEEITIDYSCINNFKNPSDTLALLPMASCYNPSLNYYNMDGHIHSGIFSHWFYLLSQGGSATNDLGNSYTVLPVGLDLSEQLIAYVTLTSAYLEDCDTFQDVRSAIYDAAIDMGNWYLADQVQNAWYAVGLDTESPHIYGPLYNQPSKYWVYLDIDHTVSWSFINTSSNASPTLVVNNSDYSCTLYASSAYSGILTATIRQNDGSIATVYSKNVNGTATSSLSSGNNSLLVLSDDNVHYRVMVNSIVTESEMREIRVYNSTNFQLLQSVEQIGDEGYVLDTSYWRPGIYIIQANVNGINYSTKITVK